MQASDMHAWSAASIHDVETPSSEVTYNTQYERAKADARYDYVHL